MADSSVIIEVPNGGKVWLNAQQIVKMERVPDGRYYVTMVNGQVFEVDRRTASKIEGYFEDLN